MCPRLAMIRARSTESWRVAILLLSDGEMRKVPATFLPLCEEQIPQHRVLSEVA
jgi:hypothetical protein